MTTVVQYTVQNCKCGNARIYNFVHYEILRSVGIWSLHLFSTFATQLQQPSSVEIYHHLPTMHTSRFSSKFVRAFDSDAEFATFYSKSADVKARVLSNFSTHTVTIDYNFIGKNTDVSYPTGEHAFQGGKFRVLGRLLEGDLSRQNELFAHARLFEGNSLQSCSIKTAAAAKAAGGKGGVRLLESEMAQWEEYSLVIQKQICSSKLVYEDVREYLLSTEGVYLVHNERATGWPRYGAMLLKPENSPFRDGRRWMQGDNLLGDMWMTAREELIAQTSA